MNSFTFRSDKSGISRISTVLPEVIKFLIAAYNNGTIKVVLYQSRDDQHPNYMAVAYFATEIAAECFMLEYGNSKVESNSEGYYCCGFFS